MPYSENRLYRSFWVSKQLVGFLRHSKSTFVGLLKPIFFFALGKGQLLSIWNDDFFKKKKLGQKRMISIF